MTNQGLEHLPDAEKKYLLEKFGLNLLDMLVAPVPEDQGQRLRLPKCPHCRRRPELVRARGKDLRIQVRTHEPGTIEIPKYELLPCCNATYSKNHKTTDISRLQARRLHDAKEKEAGL